MAQMLEDFGKDYYKVLQKTIINSHEMHSKEKILPKQKMRRISKQKASVHWTSSLAKERRQEQSIKGTSIRSIEVRQSEKQREIPWKQKEQSLEPWGSKRANNLMSSQRKRVQGQSFSKIVWLKTPQIGEMYKSFQYI